MGLPRKDVTNFHNNYLCAYDLYSPEHNVLDACISIMRGSGRGLGPGILSFLGPVKWRPADWRVPFHRMEDWWLFSINLRASLYRRPIE